MQFMWNRHITLKTLSQNYDQNRVLKQKGFDAVDSAELSSDTIVLRLKGYIFNQISYFDISK